jgi:hypothetical protein
MVFSKFLPLYYKDGNLICGFGYSIRRSWVWIHFLTRGSNSYPSEVERARIRILPSTRGLSVGYPKST